MIDDLRAVDINRQFPCLKNNIMNGQFSQERWYGFMVLSEWLTGRQEVRRVACITAGDRKALPHTSLICGRRR